MSSVKLSMVAPFFGSQKFLSAFEIDPLDDPQMTPGDPLSASPYINFDFCYPALCKLMLKQAGLLVVRQ